MLPSEQPSTNNTAILPIWMWKSNKKIERYLLLKTEFLSGGHFVSNFFENNILFGTGSTAQHEKWQKQAWVASCPQPRVLGSKQIFLWCGTEPIQEEAAKILNEHWAQKSSFPYQDAVSGSQISRVLLWFLFFLDQHKQFSHGLPWALINASS